MTNSLISFCVYDKHSIQNMPMVLVTSAAYKVTKDSAYSFHEIYSTFIGLIINATGIDTF